MSYARTTYGDCTVEIDYTLGRLLKALQESHQDENTLIFFTSDNGPEQEIEGHAHTPFRGGKGDTWEGGMRVPGIVRWPGMIAAGRQSDGLLDLSDLYPTFLGLAGFDYASASEAELPDGGSAVGEQTLFESRIDPGARHYLRAVARTDLMFVGVNQRVERGGIDQALFHQQRFQRFDPQCGTGRNQGMFVLVVGLLRVSEVVHGRCCRPRIRDEIASRCFHRVHPRR